MAGRWSILALLFAVRATMGFQYQSVAAVAPLLTRDFALTLADIGVLIGLYLAPGAVVALPGGALARRFGDKHAVLAGLFLMFAGGLVMALLPAWHAQIAGRIIAGLGGVLLNVIMSKMVTDWFAGREIASAMAIFVNSWPVGIALALMALPPVGSALGVTAVHLLSTAAVAAGGLALAVFYRSPASALAATGSGAWPVGRVLAAVVIAALVWSLYNVAFAMIFSFGPAMLAERGWTVIAAGSTVSIVMWCAIVSVPAGGLLADWTGRPLTIIVMGGVLFAASLAFAARAENAVIAAFVILGITSGLPAGAIMSLPARVLRLETRALGMGVFFTVYYVGMFVAPAAAGWLAARTGSARVAFDFGAGMLGIAMLLAFLFPSMARPPASPAR